MVARKRIGLELDDATASRIAALEETVRALIAERSTDRERIGLLEQQLAAKPSAMMVPLKPACRGRVDYETGRRWCENGVVTASKVGGRWMIDSESLDAAIKARC